MKTRFLSRLTGARASSIARLATNDLCERLESRLLLCSQHTENPNIYGAHHAGTAAKPMVHVLQAPSSTPTKKTAVAAARTYSLFEPMTSLPAARGFNAYIRPDMYTPFGLDDAGMRAALANAPREGTSAARDNPLILSLPNPNGGFSRFKVFEWNIMEAPLAAQYPEIRAYRAQGIDDPAATAQLDFTLQGFHAQVLSPGGSWYIDPYFHLDPQTPYISYYKRDLRPTGTFTESVPEGGVTNEDFDEHEEHIEGFTLDATSGSTLRNYRYVVGATGEYVAYHGGTVPLGLSAVTTSANRLSGVYETDFACRLTLVAAQSTFIYTNAATDPFTSPSSPSTSNTQNQTLMDGAGLGSANYDVGHVYYRGSDNGLAGSIGNVCVTGQKAKGYSSHSNPINDPFNIDYVAHELGHQFGGRHNFNNCGGSQGDSSAIAVEVGSGNTIMSYAGICGSTNIQAHSDAYFNSINHDQIVAYTHTGNGNLVPDQTPTGNSIPTVEAGLNYTIPANTPFTLTAVGSDANGDTLTYAWEQRNGGAVVALNTDNGSSPFMRPWAPTTDPTRTVPRLSNLLANTFALGEILPTTTRSISMVVQVRDNRAGGGGSTTDSMTISSVNTGAAFAVTAPNTAVTWNTASQTVTWNVAGTTANGINTADVAILLSTDGGLTFPNVLVASTANDGSETVNVAGFNTTTARIKVAAIGNIYFDLSNANFTINVPGSPNGIWDGGGDGVNWNDANNWSNNVLPDSLTDVTINVGANPNINVNGAQSVKSVTAAELLNITGSLTVAQASTFAAGVTITGGTLSGAGNTTFNAGLTWTGGTMTGAGSTIIPAGQAMLVNGAGVSTATRPVSIQGTGTLASGSGRTLVLSSLSITGTGKLDLTDNDFVLDYTGASQLGAVQALLNTGRNGGPWNGNGITSSSAQANGAGTTTLGAMEGSEYDAIYGAGALFGGANPDATSVLVKYTYYGDADFNGVVDFDDYVRIDAGYNLGQSGWTNGDFDGNGAVDFDDYVLIDNGYNNQGLPL